MYVRNYPIANGSHPAKETKLCESDENLIEPIDNVPHNVDDDVEADDDSDISSHRYNPNSSHVWNSHEDQVNIMSRGIIRASASLLATKRLNP